MKKVWNSISIGDKFIDGSTITEIHEPYISECYKIHWNNENILNNIFNKSKGNECTVSEDHLLLCDISKLTEKSKKWAMDTFANCIIPTEFDKHSWVDEETMKAIDDAVNNGVSYINKKTMDGINKALMDGNGKLEVVNGDLSYLGNGMLWLPCKAIFALTAELNETVICNGHRIYAEYMGKRKVFCVQTDTHKFETNGLIHHNSVALRNIIFHCLTHQYQISIALIDLKYTEFTPFKGVKGVVAVANTVKETCEIMRLAREVMYKRNQEMAKLGINDIKKFKPKQPTDMFDVAGHKMHEDDSIDIELPDGTQKTVKVKELENYW